MNIYSNPDATPFPVGDATATVANQRDLAFPDRLMPLLPSNAFSELSIFRQSDVRPTNSPEAIPPPSAP
jgi:hypothetical protein